MLDCWPETIKLWHTNLIISYHLLIELLYTNMVFPRFVNRNNPNFKRASTLSKSTLLKNLLRDLSLLTTSPFCDQTFIEIRRRRHKISMTEVNKCRKHNWKKGQ